MKTIRVGSLSDLPDAAEEILARRRGRNIILFKGDLGAGKTTLISHICRSLGSEDAVASPTFAIINQYRGQDDCVINHFDFYRVDNPEEAFDLGYEEYFYSDQLCLIEWPDKIEALIPESAMTIRIEVTGENQREITID